METVIVSPQYGIVIPKTVREALGIRPGQRMQVMTHENRVELIPLRPATELRGFLAGMNIDMEREADRL